MPVNFGRAGGFSLLAGAAGQLIEVLNMLATFLVCPSINSAFLNPSFGRMVSRSLIQFWDCCFSAWGAQHFQCLCTAFAVFTSFLRCSIMNSYASVFLLGSTVSTWSTCDFAVVIACVISYSPKFSHTVRCIRFIALASFFHTL